MSTDSTSASPSRAEAPTVTCRACGTEVPAGAYCGFCGVILSRQPGHGPDWLRAHTYGAAQAEHLLQLSVVTSLFPHLPHRSRAAFRWGLTALIAVLVVLALLRWQAALVAVSALGFPLLFLIYLEESDVYGDDDLPLPTLLLTAVLGAALGVVWVLVHRPGDRSLLLRVRSVTVAHGPARRVSHPCRWRASHAGSERAGAITSSPQPGIVGRVLDRIIGRGRIHRCRNLGSAGTPTRPRTRRAQPTNRGVVGGGRNSGRRRPADCRGVGRLGRRRAVVYLAGRTAPATTGSLCGCDCPCARAW